MELVSQGHVGVYETSFSPSPAKLVVEDSKGYSMSNRGWEYFIEIDGEPVRS
jgi:hypothetical protein